MDFDLPDHLLAYLDELDAFIEANSPGVRGGRRFRPKRWRVPLRRRSYPLR